MNNSNDKSDKYYKKALKNFQNGNIDAALNFCEKSISESIKNKSAIGLNALLFYIKGDIDNARALWKLNYEVNEDGSSRKYLADLEEDEKRFKLFMEAVSLVKVLDINRALNLFEKCCESNFNSINVYNNMALCYMNKGEFDTAQKYIDKVLEIDRKNSTAHENIKLMSKYMNMKVRFSPKMILGIIITVCIIIVGVFSYRIIKNKYFPFKNTTVNTAKSKKISIQKQNPSKENNIKNVFPFEEITSDYKAKKYENIFNTIEKWKDSKLEAKDKKLIEDCIGMLKNEGKDYFYNKGIQFFVGNEYNNTIVYFTMAEKYESDNYKLSEIYYKLGLSYEITKDNIKAIESYKKYDEGYSSGIYEETVLYRLFTLSSTDTNTSKAYANKLYTTFKDSIYINDRVKEAINSK